VVQNASALGSSSASITLIEFGDYHCQSCAKFYRETGEQLFNNFLKTGQIRFLFKDYIINDNNSSTADTSFPATEASYCAADQGKYWQYHNALYDFSQTANTTQWATKDNLKQLARNVGIANILQFSNCLESHKYTKTVNENNNFARSIGVQTIPTFVLLSQRTKPLAIQGAQSYSIFEQAIREIQSASAQP
jgi:protein-disulfide isomerase